MSFFDFVLFVAALAVAWEFGIWTALLMIKKKAPDLYEAVSKAISSKGEK